MNFSIREALGARRPSIRTVLLLSALLAFGAVACSSDSDDDRQPGAGGSGGQGGDGGTGGQGGDGGSGGVEPTLARVEVTPAEATVVERRTVQLSAEGFDEEDVEFEGLTFAWSSSDEQLATVDGEGLVTSLRPGVVKITANVGDVVGEATLTITASTATSLELQAETSEIPMDGEVPLRPVVKDAEEFVLLDRNVTFESADEAVAVVKKGAVVGVELGETKITAKLESLEASVDVRVVHRFTKLFAGGDNTCGLTVAGRAWCWGDGDALGGGDEDMDDSPQPVRVAVESGIAFQSVAVGDEVACGLTTDGEVWCWGDNGNFVLRPEEDDLYESSVPLLLADRSYKAISATGGSVCGLDEAGHAHCWGYNSSDFELGDPDNTDDSWIPLAVSAPEGESAPVSFIELRHGYYFSCGLNSARTLYCWGYNSDFQLGDGTDESRAHAVKPLGDTAVKAFGLGEEFACATTFDDDTYCWGENSDSQAFFDPDNSDDIETPLLRFEATTFVPAAFALGDDHGCALDKDGRAFCWGDNWYKQLGRTTDESTADIGEVAGGLRFTQLVAGEDHTCGLATDGKAYCWGYNGDGQLGTGDFDDMEEPTPVAGQ